jgi:hypothetical protein
MAVSGVAARRASGLRPSYYPFGYPMMYASEEEEKGRGRRGRRKEREEGKHGRMVRSGHGLLRVSLGPTMPYPYTPCRRPPLKRLHDRFKSGHPQGERPAAILLPLWIPHDVHLRGGREGKGAKGKRKGKEGGEE